MRSRMNATVTLTSGQVYSWTLEFLLKDKLLKDHGWQCTAAVVLSIVLRAAARCISVFAACRDLACGPCAQAVMDALSDGLPKTLPVLERRCGHSAAANTAQHATGENAGDFVATLFGRHAFGVGCRDHGKAPRWWFAVPTLVTYAVGGRRAHER